MLRAGAALLLLALLVAPAAEAQVSGIAPGAFGAKAWRENGLAPGSLPLTGNTIWDVRLASDGALYYWSGTAWVAIAGGGGAPSGPAGGDLSGTYPNPAVQDDSHAHTGTTISGLDAADTTSGTFADARISSSSVTQHESALEAVLDIQDLQGVATPAQLATGTPAPGKYPDGSGVWTLLPPDTNSGGTVQSVSGPSEISWATATTTPTASWANQTQAKVLASPATSTGTPGFRALVSADIPTLPYLADSAATDDTVPTGSGSAWQAKALPNCTDSGGNHLNYTAATNAWSCGTSGGVTVPGSDTQVLFNDVGALGADAGMTYNKTTDTLTLGTQLTVSTVASPAGTAAVYQATAPIVTASAQAGVSASLKASDAVAGSSNAGAAIGGAVTIQAGDAKRLTSGNADGGPINLVPGTAIGTGAPGQVLIGAFGGLRTVSGITYMTNATSTGVNIVKAGRFYVGADQTGGNVGIFYANAGIANFEMSAGSVIGINSTASATGSPDTTLSRISAGLWGMGTGAAGSTAGSLQASKFISTPQSLTIADNGNGSTRATSTLTPTTSFVMCSCGDPQGCDVTVSETGAVDGQQLEIVNVGTNICGFADTANVTELAGAFDMGTGDVLGMRYSTALAEFVERYRSNN